MGDLGLLPGLGRSPGEGKGYPLQYSGLENSMDCIVHGVAKSRTQRSNSHFTSHIYFTDIYVHIYIYFLCVGVCVYIYVCVHVCSVTKLCPTLCDPMDCSQSPLSTGYSRQEYWNGLPFSPPGDREIHGSNSHLLHPLYLLHWQADPLPLSHLGSPSVYVYMVVVI